MTRGDFLNCCAGKEGRQNFDFCRQPLRRNVFQLTQFINDVLRQGLLVVQIERRKINSLLLR